MRSEYMSRHKLASREHDSNAAGNNYCFYYGLNIELFLFIFLFHMYLSVHLSCRIQLVVIRIPSAGLVTGWPAIGIAGQVLSHGFKWPALMRLIYILIQKSISARLD